MLRDFREKQSVKPKSGGCVRLANSCVMVLLLGAGSTALAAADSANAPASTPGHSGYVYGQAQTQGAGTPNQVSAGGFLPIYQDGNSLWYADVQLGLALPDFSGYSSIINTDVAGGTLATSTRVGRRWLDETGLWMFGLYAGFDTRQLKSGGADQSDITITDKRTVNFQQMALGLEAKHRRLSAKGYALIPVGDKEQTLNNTYGAGALNTYGLDLGWAFTPKLTATLGSYYQQNNMESVDGWGVAVGARYAFNDQLSFGATYSNDSAFNSRVMANLTYRFGVGQSQGRSAAFDLTEPVSHRGVRVHDISIISRDRPYQRRRLGY